MNSYQLLDFIRRRPAMYIGYETPTHLHAFLSGYWHSQLEVHKEQLPTDAAAENHFSEFHDWVAKKLGYYESTAGWARMIAAERADQQEAFWLFYQLLDEYRQLIPHVIAEIRVGSDSRYFNGLTQNTNWPLPKPQPTCFSITEVLPHREWVVLIARYHDTILYMGAANSVAEAQSLAYKKFEIPDIDWDLMD